MKVMEVMEVMGVTEAMDARARLAVSADEALIAKKNRHPDANRDLRIWRR